MEEDVSVLKVAINHVSKTVQVCGGGGDNEHIFH